MFTPPVSGIGPMPGSMVADISLSNVEVASLDDRLRDTFAATSVSTQNAYNDIMAKVSNPELVSMPGALLDLQVQLGEYRYQVETISALTRKGVATVETLLRS